MRKIPFSRGLLSGVGGFGGSGVQAFGVFFFLARGVSACCGSALMMMAAGAGAGSSSSTSIVCWSPFFSTTSRFWRSMTSRFFCRLRLRLSQNCIRMIAPTVLNRSERTSMPLTPASILIAAFSSTFRSISASLDVKSTSRDARADSCCLSTSLSRLAHLRTESTLRTHRWMRLAADNRAVRRRRLRHTQSKSALCRTRRAVDQRFLACCRLAHRFRHARCMNRAIIFMSSSNDVGGKETHHRGNRGACVCTCA